MLNVTNHQEMQNQTRIRYHITPLLVTIIKKAGGNKCWWRCGEKQTLFNFCWSINLCSHYGEQRFLTKLKIELPYDPAVILPGMYPEKFKPYPQQMKLLIKKVYSYPCALQLYLEEPRHNHWRMNGLWTCELYLYMHTH